MATINPATGKPYSDVQQKIIDSQKAQLAGAKAAPIPYTPIPQNPTNPNVNTPWLNQRTLVDNAAATKAADMAGFLNLNTKTKVPDVVTPHAEAKAVDQASKASIDQTNAKNTGQPAPAPITTPAVTQDPWQKTNATGGLENNLDYVPTDLSLDPAFTKGNFTPEQKTKLIQNYFKAHPELGVNWTSDIAMTDTEAMAQLAKANKAEMDYLTAQQDFSIKQSREQTAGATSAAASAFGAVSREGAQSTGNMSLAAETIQRYTANQSNLEAQLVEQKRQLQAAQDAGMTKAAESIAHNIAVTQQNLLDTANKQMAEVKGMIAAGGLVGSSDEELATIAQQLSPQNSAMTLSILKGLRKSQQLNYGTEEQKQKALQLDTLQKSLDGMGEFASKLDTKTLMSMATQNNLSFGQISAMKELAVLKSQLTNTKDRASVDQITANINKLQEELKFVGMPENAKEFEYYSKLTPEQQQAYNVLKSTGKDFQLVQDSINGGFLVFDKDTGKVTNLNSVTQGLRGNFDITKMETRAISGGASNGAGRVDPLTVVSGYSIKNKELLGANGEVLGKITSVMGQNNAAISGEKSHNGIDVVFNGGNVKALASGTVVKTGVAPKTYGGYVWVADGAGNVLQYGHVNVEQMGKMQVGQTIAEGEVFIQNETNKSKMGAASGAHTDIRFVGKAAAEKGLGSDVDELTKQYMNKGVSYKEAHAQAQRDVLAGINPNDLLAKKDTEQSVDKSAAYNAMMDIVTTRSITGYAPPELYQKFKDEIAKLPSKQAANEGISYQDQYFAITNDGKIYEPKSEIAKEFMYLTPEKRIQKLEALKVEKESKDKKGKRTYD